MIKCFRGILILVLMLSLLLSSMTSCRWLFGLFGNENQFTDNESNDNNNNGSISDDEDLDGKFEISEQSTAIVGKFTDREITSEESAILAIKDVAEELNIVNATAELTSESTNTVDNLTYYKLQQNYQGIPVYGCSVVVISDENGESRGIYSSATNVNENISVTPTVEDSVVREKINDYFCSGTLCTELNDDNLIIYSDDSNSHTLAYSMTVIDGGIPYSVILSASSGEILKSSPLLFTSDADKVPTIEDMLRERVEVYNANGNAFCYYIYEINDAQYLRTDDFLYDWKGIKQFKIDDDEIFDLEGKFVTKDPEILYVVYSLELTDYDTVVYHKADELIMSNPNDVASNDQSRLLVEGLSYSHAFFKRFDRNGYDDNDGDILAVIGDSSSVQNAYALPWNNKGIICIGQNMPANIDLVAHEYTHLVEQSISGMDYSGESGAIMEAYSDVFGELVEDWENDGILDGNCDWKHISPNYTITRDISDPNGICCAYKLQNLKCPNILHNDKCLKVKRNPDSITSRFFKDVNDLENDNGNIHHNSTVISHAAYLMTKKYDMAPERLAKLWYETLFLLPSDCSFVELYSFMKTEALILGYTTDEINAIDKAFGKVGISDTSYESDLYKNSFSIEVLDENEEYYNDCRILIYGTKDGSSDDTAHILKEISMESNPQSIYLPDGKYFIVIHDTQDDSQAVYRQIVVSEKSGVRRFLRVIAKHVHNYITQYYSPTCTEDGLRRELCDCGAFKDVEVLEATGHNWMEWIPAGNGYRERTCVLCGTKETEEIHTHSYTPTIIAPTCTTEGYIVHICSTCGDSYKGNIVGVINHNYVNGKCSVCGTWSNDVPFVEYGNHRYVLYDVSLTWHEAKAFCESMGGHLVTITSAEEQATIEKLLESGSKKQYWMGMDTFNGRWITGESIVYTKWDEGQPDKLDREDGEYERYVQIYNEKNPAELLTNSQKYHWNDAFFDNYRYGEENFFLLEYAGFICEIEPQCNKPTFTTPNGVEVEQGNGLTLIWNAPVSPADSVEYFIAIMQAGKETETYTDVTSEWINETSYEISSMYFVDAGTYVVTLYARAEGYLQSQASINVLVDNSYFGFNFKEDYPISNLTDRDVMSSAPYAYADTTLFSNKKIVQIDVPVGTVSAVDENQYFTLWVVKSSTIKVGGKVTDEYYRQYKIYIPIEEITSTTVDKWISIDVSHLDICVGADETLAFMKATDTVICCFKKDNKHIFYCDLTKKGVFQPEYSIYYGVKTEAWYGEIEKPSNSPDSSQGLSFKSNNDGTCYVTGRGSCTNNDIVIPEYAPNGERVIGIGRDAFDWEDITSVVIPEGVLYIEETAFYECDHLTRITIPSSVKEIRGVNTFSWCLRLEEVHISDLTSWCSLSFSNESANPLSNQAYLYLNGSLVEHLVIPDGVTKIKKSAFTKCKGIKSIVLPESVRAIEDGAFYNCNQEYIYIPTTVEQIGSYAFANSTSWSKKINIYYQGTEAEWKANKFSFWGSPVLHYQSENPIKTKE